MLHVADAVIQGLVNKPVCERDPSPYDGTTRRSNGDTDWTGVVHQHDDRLHQPLRWRKPRLVFVDSMSDLFHPSVSSSIACFCVVRRGAAHGRPRRPSVRRVGTPRDAAGAGACGGDRRRRVRDVIGPWRCLRTVPPAPHSNTLGDDHTAEEQHRTVRSRERGPS